MSLEHTYYPIVLAAGFGTRMRPITNVIPKPLVEFCGIPTVMLAIERYISMGFKSFGINSHYFTDQITEFLCDHYETNQYYHSIEKEKPLGSGGVYPLFNEIRKQKAVIACNGDVVSDLNIDDLVKFHEETQGVACLALLPKLNPKGNSVWFDEKGRVVGICPTKPKNAVGGGTFSGFQIISDRIIQSLPINQEVDIIATYNQAILEKKEIFAKLYPCQWFDIGTASDYHKAHMSFFPQIEVQKLNSTFGYFEALNRMQISFDFISSDRITEHCKIFAPSILLGDSSLEVGCEIGPYSVISDGCYVGKRAMLNNVYLHKMTSIRDSKKFDHCLVCNDQTLTFVV